MLSLSIKRPPGWLAPRTSSAGRNEARYGNVQVWYWGFAILQIEFQRVSYDDLTYTTASILFVLGYIMYHTQSFFLGALGMVQIVLTLPAALFFYRCVVQGDANLGHSDPCIPSQKVTRFAVSRTKHTGLSSRSRSLISSTSSQSTSCSASAPVRQAQSSGPSSLCAAG
eukprot:SAG22_NODE_2113_length_2993_cov_25.505874_3_plen_169_part_00